MEIDIELNCLDLPDWYAALNKNFVAMPNIQLTEIRQAPGTFGADWTPKLRAHLSTAADLAQLISVVVALYALPATSVSQTCQVKIMNGSTIVEMVVPCQTPSSQEFIDTIANALDKFAGKLPTIKITPTVKV